MIQSNTSDFHFSWNQMPNAIGRLPWQQCLNPTLPILLAWPELSVTMETLCVALKHPAALCDYLCVCVIVNAKRDEKKVQLVVSL